MSRFMERFLAPHARAAGCWSIQPSVLAVPGPVWIESPWCSAWKSRRTARSPAVPLHGALMRPRPHLGGRVTRASSGAASSGASSPGPSHGFYFLEPFAEPGNQPGDSQPRPPAARTVLLDLQAPPHSWGLTSRERSPKNPPSPTGTAVTTHTGGGGAQGPLGPRILTVSQRGPTGHSL